MSRQKTESAPSHAAPKKRRGKGLVITLFIIAAILVGLRLYIRPPGNITRLSKPPSVNTSLPSDGDSGEAVKGNINKKAYTCLLVGQRDGMTDTIMLAMIDLDNKTAGVMSIPRDTVVAVSRRVPKINGAYSNGGGGDEGMDKLLDEVATLVGYRPNNYCIINMNAFVKIVDQLGGVEFDVPIRMYKPYEGIDLQPGLQTLNGKKALQLVRFRTYGKDAAKVGIDHDDYGRMQIQQMFLKAMIEQALTLDNIKNVPAIIDIVGKNMRTDMDAGNIAWYAEQVLKLGIGNITFATMPTYSIHYGNSSMAKGYYEIVDSEEALKMINQLVNPFTFEITKSMVDHAPDPSK